MHLISAIADWWLGLCRKPPALHLRTGMDIPPEHTLGDCPAGGTGGPGTIRRGAGAAASGIKTLVRNPQLLGFPLFFALVLLVLSLMEGVLTTITSSLEWRAFIDPSISQLRFSVDPFLTRWWPGFYPDTALSLYSFAMTAAQTLIVEIVTIFCLVFLLAGLVLSFPSQNGGAVSCRQGLSRVKKYKKPLAVWSVIMALAGTLSFIIFQYYCMLSPVIVQFLSCVLSQQNPFNYVINPNVPVSILPGVVAELSLVSIYTGLIDTLILSAINVLLFILTLFVVPLIVLEQKSAKEAFSESVALIKKVWPEVAACILTLGSLACAAFLASLLFPAVAGENLAIGHWPPPAGWLVAGMLYVLTLTILVVFLITAGGIATRDLYLSAKHDRNTFIL